MNIYKKSLIPSIIIITLIIIFFYIGLIKVIDEQNIIQIDIKDISHIVLYSSFQSAISATITIIISFILAKAFFYIDFKYKNFILKLISITFSLPTIIVIFAILSIYGNQGVINNFLELIGIDSKIVIYGLLGIVIAHVFFNIGYCTNIFYKNLLLIPNEQKKLVDHLNIKLFTRFYILDFYYCKNNFINLWLLVFMLSFNSFAIVLFLGGGPRFSSLEVSIYNAIQYEMNITNAANLVIVQIIFNILILIISTLIDSPIKINQQINKIYKKQINLINKSLYLIFLLIILTYIFSPIIYILYEFIINIFNSKIKEYNFIFLLHTIFNSLIISLIASFLSIVVSFIILYGFRWWLITRLFKIANILINFSFLTLIVPSLSLSLGFYLLLMNFDIQKYQLIILVAITNGLASLPYCIKYLQNHFIATTQNYKLSTILHLSNWQNFKLIEFSYIKKPLISAFTFSMVISLGDFSIISLFGNSDFNTLPYLLSTQLSGYNKYDGTITAGFLLIIIFIIKGISIKYDKTK